EYEMAPEDPKGHAALHTLSDRHPFLGEQLSVGEAALEQGAHRAKHRRPPLIERLSELVGQSRDGLDLAVDGLEVGQFEQIAEPPHVGLYRHLPRAAALRQSYELVGHDQAPAEMLRGPERPVPAVERARQGHRVAEPARNVERLLAEREAALH